MTGGSGVSASERERVSARELAVLLGRPGCLLGQERAGEGEHERAFCWADPREEEKQRPVLSICFSF
jgi:hypothetical protein